MKKDVLYGMMYAVAGVLAATATVKADNPECVTVKVDENNAWYDIDVMYATTCKDGVDIGPSKRHLLLGMTDERQVVKGSKIKLWLYTLDSAPHDRYVFTITEPTKISCHGTAYTSECGSEPIPSPKLKSPQKAAPVGKPVQPKKPVEEKKP